MRGDRPSWTAEMAAFARALHLRTDDPPVFEDPFAVRMLSPLWRAMVTVAPLRWYADHVLFRGLRKFRAGLQVRSRYAEERLEAAARRGVRQYVILAAGLDTFALRRRDLAAALAVFEVDHPATQRGKVERLAAAGLQLPPRVRLIPLDFDCEALHVGLAKADHDPASPTFFSWVGTTYYLTLDAFRATLRSIGSFAASGSEIVFDYMVPAHQLAGPDRRRLALTNRLGKRRGEPTRMLMSAQDMKAEIEADGLEVIEDLSASDMRERYLAGRSDGLEIYPGYRYLSARRP